MKGTKEKLKDEIFGWVKKEESNGVVLGYGVNAIVKDLFKVLGDDEEIEKFIYANRRGISGSLRGGRIFRNYMVCTNKRLICLQKVSGIFALLPFLHKVFYIQYKTIDEVEVKKRIGLFSGILTIKSDCKKYSFNVSDLKTAETMKYWIEQKQNKSEKEE